ncbi:phospholipase A and acyltransferase 5 [Megaptera novaeangliae]
MGVEAPGLSSAPISAGCVRARAHRARAALAPRALAARPRRSLRACVPSPRPSALHASSVPDPTALPTRGRADWELAWRVALCEARGAAGRQQRDGPEPRPGSWTFAWAPVGSPREGGSSSPSPHARAWNLPGSFSRPQQAVGPPRKGEALGVHTQPEESRVEFSSGAWECGKVNKAGSRGEEFEASGVASVFSNRAVVTYSRLEDVLRGCSWKVNNKLDGTYLPLPVDKIVQRTKKMVNKIVQYSLIEGNCEHFVNDLRYGVPRSQQVEHMLMEGAKAAGAVLSAVVDSLRPKPAMARRL